MAFGEAFIRVIIVVVDTGSEKNGLFKMSNHNQMVKEFTPTQKSSYLVQL